MKILFAPSESKEYGGKFPPINKDSFCCPELYEKRLEVLKIYQDFIDNASIEELKKLFGVKDEKQVNKFRVNIFKEKTLKAVERYNGVAYQYLNYSDLPEEQKNFIDENLIIFSNLFGAILARDKIPFYKLKQAESIGGFKPEQFYKQHFQKAIDEFIGDELLIDLRAGFYEKFYTIKKPYITMKFLKNGKVVSHWAKAYRGLVVKKLSEVQPETEEQILSVNFENMKLIEVNKSKNKKELIYEIVSN